MNDSIYSDYEWFSLVFKELQNHQEGAGLEQLDQLLLDGSQQPKPFDLNSFNGYQTPLGYVIRHNRKYNLVQSLIQRGADAFCVYPHIIPTDKDDYYEYEIFNTPWRLEVNRSKRERESFKSPILELFLKSIPTDLYNIQQMTAVVIASCEPLDFLDLMLNSGAIPNHPILPGGRVNLIDLAKSQTHFLKKEEFQRQLIIERLESFQVELEKKDLDKKLPTGILKSTNRL